MDIMKLLNPFSGFGEGVLFIGFGGIIFIVGLIKGKKLDIFMVKATVGFAVAMVIVGILFLTGVF